MAGTATHRPFVHLTGQRAASEQPRSLNPWTAEPRAGTCPAGRCSGGRIRRIPRGAERSCPPSRSEPCHHPHCAAGWRRPAAERMRQAARLPGCAASRLHHGAMPLTERQRTAQLTARVRRLPAPPVLEDAVCASGKFDRAMWYSRSRPEQQMGHQHLHDLLPRPGGLRGNGDKQAAWSRAAAPLLSCARLGCWSRSQLPAGGSRSPGRRGPVVCCIRQLRRLGSSLPRLVVRPPRVVAA